MPGEVLDRVLPFAEWIVGRRSEYPRPVLNRVLMVTIGVFHPHHHGMTIFAGETGLFRYDYSAVAGVQLCPVIGNSDTQAEAECMA
jgi:hypothetical protein